jgi:hypothetical protein
VRWHRSYDVEGSTLTQRLAVVQGLLRTALDAAPTGRPIRLVSLCAGRGTDVIDVLRDHARAADVQARLVELDPDLAARARSDAAAAGLDGVEVVTGDASSTDAAAGAAPVDVVLACGIFGNVSDEDIHRFVDLTPTLCAPRATVIWTRHRRPPDLTTDIRAWFAAAGFDELAFVAPDASGFVGVGAHRLRTDPQSFVAGVRMFTFVGDGIPT